MSRNNQYKLRTFTCLGCGETVTLRRAKSKTKYCSLACWRNSKRPQRMTGETVKCVECGKSIYKPKNQLDRVQNSFCSQDCANKWQGRNKIEITCKVCGIKFKVSKSRVTYDNTTYCSIKCRSKDKDWIRNACIKGNLVQQNNKGANKLEICGGKILRELGIEFQEQILMFEKFLVDVLIPEKKIVVQWDGVYWHSKPKRKQLDDSQDKYLAKCGYKVLRYTDKQIKEDREAVKQDIIKQLSP